MKTKAFSHKHWRPIYGWAVIAIGTGLLDADGNHTDSRLQRIFSHAPGDVVTSAGGKSTGAAPARYIVNPNQSLTRI